MRTLFIDTSTSDVSIAIISDGKVLSSINKSVPNAHSVYTVSFLDKVIITSAFFMNASTSVICEPIWA